MNVKKRYKLTLAYDGTQYVGWQFQKNGISIQEKLSEAISTITGKKLRPIGAGRTDSGVHALGQVAHLDLEWSHSEENLLRAFNSILPVDIRVLEVTAVPGDFHAQKYARQKWYRYAVHVGAQH
jgi:tRNA pseudouridine38-40 synthase